MKYLVVGLGNPGVDYAETRHNIGFKTLDALAGASNVVFTPSRYADVAEIKHKGRTLILIKPQTFMNLSGKAVNYWLQQEKIPAERMMVITDDIALPFGKIRIRAKGKSRRAQWPSAYPRGVGNPKLSALTLWRRQRFSPRRAGEIRTCPLERG